MEIKNQKVKYALPGLKPLTISLSTNCSITRAKSATIYSE